MTQLNETHDPSLISWVDSAHGHAVDFPIQNLPFSVFRPKGGDHALRVGVAIGDQIVDLLALAALAPFSGDAGVALSAAAGTSLNDLMALGPIPASALRRDLSRALRKGSALQGVIAQCLVPQATAEHAVPAHIGDYTDFYTSIHHATNIGRQFRPDQPLLPNYQWVPIGYHGRASSIQVSGHSFPRPVGQMMRPGAATPVVGPCERLDYELELGLFIGQGNAAGQPVSMRDAPAHLFGICLLNDWSSRDVQAWEYQPLGPFLSKNFATTISPWIVTLEALAPFRVPFVRPDGAPDPLPYLDSPEDRTAGALDIRLDVLLQSQQMRQDGIGPQRLTSTSYRHAYWTAAQLVTHHTMNGCNLRPGDLLGSGTLSGPTLPEAGALIELTVGGKQPITLDSGETRTYLADGDSVTLRGWCEAPGMVSIGLGSCTGTVMPSSK